MAQGAVADDAESLDELAPGDLPHRFVRQAAGIGQGLIRVAVGLEHPDDIKADLLRGLDTL